MDEPKFGQICFCCLSEEGHLKNMLDEAFVANQVKVQFVEGYTTISGISPDDEASKHICPACELKLKQCYEFRQLCRASFKTLTDRSRLIAGFCLKREVPSDADEEGTATPAEIVEFCDGKQTVYLRDVFSPDTDPPTKIERMVSSEDDGPDRDESRDDLHKHKRHKKAKRLKKSIPTGVDASNLEATFVCYHCDLVLPTHSRFLKHREQHMVGKRYSSIERVCSLCRLEVSHFVKHITEAHKDYRPNRCGYCSKGRFQTASELKAHLAGHVKGEPTHQCRSCRERFKNEVTLRSHIINHRNSSNCFLCPYCGLEFARFADCREHFAGSHDAAKKLYPCFHCKRTYLVGKYYDDHECPKAGELVDITTSSVRCPACALPFSCDDELACHRARGCATEKATSKCHICDKEFETRSKLTRHLKSHDPKRRLFVCDTCGHGSMSESQMKLHKFMHVTDRPFQCQLCPATFKLDQHLKGHQKVHRPAPFECYLCEKKFRTYDNIRLHMGTHSDASVLRRFACELCGKTSVSGTALGRHMKTHTHEKNFKCGQCDRNFRDIGGVNKHVRKVHEGLFYECKFCGKTYKEKMKFRNHLYVHRGFKPFNCPVCPSQHVEKYIFIKHLRVQHSITFVEKIHGYRETENINALIDECERIPFKKGQATSETPSASGSVQNDGPGEATPGQVPFLRPMQYESKY